MLAPWIVRTLHFRSTGCIASPACTGTMVPQCCGMGGSGHETSPMGCSRPLKLPKRQLCYVLTLIFVSSVLMIDIASLWKATMVSNDFSTKRFQQNPHVVYINAIKNSVLPQFRTLCGHKGVHNKKITMSLQINDNNNIIFFIIMFTM